MGYSRTLLPPMVSSAVALIAVTNYSVISLLGSSGSSARDILPEVLSIGVPTSLAVILVMSNLYHALEETVAELDERRKELLLKSQRDTLTGIASREYFEEKLASAVARFQRCGELFSVILLDLDHFKRVNDLHGHQTGDALLKQVSKRLNGKIPSTDTVARLGGDEYVILLTNVSGRDYVQEFCADICDELEKPYQVANLELRVSASVGALLASDLSCEEHNYLRAADVALYEAKSRGRNCYQFFSCELDQNLRRRDRLESDLRRALHNAEGIDVFFQPQIDAVGKLTGAEALFRWKHPELGDIPALEAVGIAEDSNLILELGEFVFRRSAKFAREHPDLSVAINLSPAQFMRSKDFAHQIGQMACDEQVHPSQLEFEITERLFIEIGSESESQIQALRSNGFRVALDDFGTGYSSLSYLRRFQVDRLKLDKSFAEGARLQESVAVIRAAVGLAHLLGLEVVAEGIENAEQETIALESGCDGLQGNYYGAPAAAESFQKYIDRRSSEAA